MDNTVDMDKKGRRVSCAGESSYNSKLTNEEVLFIRKTYVPYDRVRGGGALARMLGVNPNVVTEIAAKRKWAHI